MVTIAKDTFNMFRFFFSRTLFGEMIIGALDTPGAVIAVSLGVSISLAFAALWYVSLRAGRFKLDFGVIECIDLVNSFVVFTRFEVNEE
jgi:hypothetical protein